jgi:hypothetical protein
VTNMEVGNTEIVLKGNCGSFAPPLRSGSSG